MENEIVFLDYFNPSATESNWVPAEHSLVFCANLATRDWIFAQMKVAKFPNAVLEGAAGCFPCILGISRPDNNGTVVEQMAVETLVARLNVLARVFQKPTRKDLS